MLYIGLISLCIPVALFIIGIIAIGIGYITDRIKFRKLTPQLLLSYKKWRCPNCRSEYSIKQRYVHCPKCGKKIDWSNISF